MNASLLGIPYPILFIILFVVVAWLFQNRTAEGRMLYALGSSPGAARILGLPITGLTIAVYTIAGLCAGITAFFWLAIRRALRWTWAMRY